MQWEPTSDAADLKARIEAERTGQAFLYWKDVDARQQILMLDPDTERVTVGRRGDQDIVLDWDKQVSRAHALLEKRGGDWTLIDELSQNGSYLNGDRINRRVRLDHKDVMCFGSTRITSRIARGPRRTRPRAPPRRRGRRCRRATATCCGRCAGRSSTTAPPCPPATRRSPRR